MLSKPRIRSAKWIPSQDLSSASKLSTRYNRGRLHEIFWEYSDLTAEVLKDRGARFWLYHENDELCGFALGRYTQVGAPAKGIFVFEEVWGPCHGVSSELGRPSRTDVERAHRFRELVGSENLSPIILRAATDNQFAHIVARVLKAKWVNGLIIAQRILRKKVKISIPSGYKFRVFREGDEFYMSKIHHETFGEILSPEAYEAWAMAPNCRTTVATHDGKPIGFIIAEKRAYGRMGDFNIAVTMSHQGKGVGSALLKTAFNNLIGLGARKVIADYLMLNRSAHTLYEKHGFRSERTYSYFAIT